MLGKLLIFCALAAIVGEGIDADATARSKDARHLYIFRVHQSDKIFHDDVDAILMKVAVVAEAKQVEFQAFAFHHAHVGHILYAYLRKVGLSGDGAKRRELRAVELHLVVVSRMFVYETLKHFGGIVVPVLCLCAKSLQSFIFSCVHNSL